MVGGVGRPRAFDDDEVLGRALSLFWRKGFSATSVQDLVDETGLSRASLYSSFGNKEDLLARVLERYQARMAPAGRALAEAASVRAGLRQFFERWADVACPASGPKGCLLMQTANEGDPNLAWVEELQRASAAAIDQAFTAAIKRGKRSGELHRDLDVRATVEFLDLLTQGLAAKARAGATRKSLLSAVETGLAALG